MWRERKIVGVSVFGMIGCVCVYVCVWKHWHVYRETGMFLEESCVCVCGGRPKGMCGREMRVWI